VNLSLHIEAVLSEGFFFLFLQFCGFESFKKNKEFQNFSNFFGIQNKKKFQNIQKQLSTIVQKFGKNEKRKMT
jgi:hypothetical protein